MGPECSYLIGIIGVVGLISTFFARGYFARKRKPIWTLWATDIGFIVGTLLSLPLSIVMVLIWLSQAVAILVTKQIKPLVGRIAVTAFFAAIATLFFFLFADQKIIIRGTEISSEPLGFMPRMYNDGPDVVDKRGLEIHALGGHELLLGPDWYSWTLYNSHNHGPHWAGYTRFWGPHGPIRGDDLGKYVGKWAGVQPEYRMR